MSSSTALRGLRMPCPCAALPLFRSYHVFEGDAPIDTRTLNFGEVYPQILGLLLGSLRGIRFLLDRNQLAGDARSNADVAIRYTLLNLVRQILPLISRHRVAFGVPPEAYLRLRHLLKAQLASFHVGRKVDGGGSYSSRSVFRFLCG